MSFDSLKFISDKKSGKSHSPQEITDFVKNLVDGSLSDYQVSAWLMATCFNGLDFAETYALTKAMTHSGKVMQWGDGPPVVDKHSTGGVGDTVTLVLAPMAAALGMRMGKHSGRGLGHTGGTIDKLESIPGFRTSIDEDEFRSIVNDAGCAVAGQDRNMTPADGILYGLRDVTSTVEQESLIASSIMSKKLAGGAPAIILDVKVGSGAFMKDIPSAQSLADLMIKIGRESGVKITAKLSWMNQPLGAAIGNALEVKEAIRVLKNECGPTDPLRHVCIEFASQLMTLSGISVLREARNSARSVLEDGSALERFRRMVELQGGVPEVIDEPDKILPGTSEVYVVESKSKGTIHNCDALTLGEIVRDLGGGRRTKSDEINPSVGIVLFKRPGDMVEPGDPLCEIHSDQSVSKDKIPGRALSAFQISGEPYHAMPVFVDQ